MFTRVNQKANKNPSRISLTYMRKLQWRCDRKRSATIFTSVWRMRGRKGTWSRLFHNSKHQLGPRILIKLLFYKLRSPLVVQVKKPMASHSSQHLIVELTKLVAMISGQNLQPSTPLSHNGKVAFLEITRNTDSSRSMQESAIISRIQSTSTQLMRKLRQCT